MLRAFLYTGSAIHTGGRHRFRIEFRIDASEAPSVIPAGFVTVVKTENAGNCHAGRTRHAIFAVGAGNRPCIVIGFADIRQDPPFPVGKRLEVGKGSDIVLQMFRQRHSGEYDQNVRQTSRITEHPACSTGIRIRFFVLSCGKMV